MDLTGGINMYASYYEDGIRYLNGTTPYGRKIKYLDEGGWNSDTVNARNKGLTKDHIYTVKEIYVGRSFSEVVLLEVEGKFNTVMFEDVE